MEFTYFTDEEHVTSARCRPCGVCRSCQGAAQHLPPHFCSRSIEHNRDMMARSLKHSPLFQEHIALSSPSEEEHKGLLSGIDSLSAIEAEAEDPTQSKLLSFGVRIGVLVVGLLGLGFGFLCWFSAPPNSIKALHFNGDTLRSNGTHDFKRTVLLVSIDGLRHALSHVLIHL